MAKDVKAGQAQTVQGSELTLATTGGAMADNGVIHAIGTVGMPK